MIMIIVIVSIDYIYQSVNYFFKNVVIFKRQGEIFRYENSMGKGFFNNQMGNSGNDYFYRILVVKFILSNWFEVIKC